MGSNTRPFSDMTTPGLVTSGFSTSPLANRSWSSADATTTTQTTSFHQPNLTSSVVQSVVLIVIWIPAIVGNILTCLVVHRSRRLQSTTNYFVISLALADLVLSILAIPYVLGQAVTNRWVFASFMCRFVRFVQYLAPGTTSFVFVSICIDRFYTILHPLSFAVTRVRARQLVLAAWLLAAALASPSFFAFQVVTETNGAPFCMMYVHNSPAAITYVAIVALVSFVLPVILCCVFYLRISRFIWRVGFGGRPLQRTTNPVPRAKVKMVKMLIALNVTTVVLMAPFIVVQVVRCAVHFLDSLEEKEALYVVVVWIYFSSAASKPILYVSLNSNFRRGCKEMFCMSAMKCYRSQAYTITTMSTLAKKNHVGVIDRPISVGADPVSYGSGNGGVGWTSLSPEFHHYPHRGTGEENGVQNKTPTDNFHVMADKSAWPGSGEVSPSTYV